MSRSEGLKWVVVVIIVRWLNLEPPLQSSPINTDVVGSQPAQGELYNSGEQQVGGFLRVLWFPPLIKMTTTIYLKYC